ncbi:efflux RND transporter periplasmic adaptor subunit [Atopomonas sediminilitoris]|uniref:efflux RND transporter periplasmic adaptor subunit n=1 Tax=Atopomonas sediminilitoris TaxID=2919919 RepID=UPI001F4DB8D0|nr:efflux RND transporter periplasmic adaptor subunit [Atopomonas sediminilitoris]MCJ8169673.1 efflux RND transporter periplasmic adaptor subunit [Atopomonas sediminilitoris]
MLTALKTKPWLLAAVIAVALLLWMALGKLSTMQDSAPEAQLVAEAQLAQVQIQWLEAQKVPRALVVQGQLEPWRRVELRAQVAGVVERLDKDKGSRVQAGERLLTLSGDARPAEVTRARAAAAQQQAEMEAAQRLLKNRLISSNDLLKVKAEQARAQAELAMAELALARTQIDAPFAGVYDQRMVEPGDYVEPGQSLLTLVDVSQLKVAAQVPQQEVLHLQLGQAVQVELLDGRRLSGQVHFIAAAADAGTRSFRIEVAVANPDRQRIAGASATLRVATGDALAHGVSPALLSLDKDGRPGIKWLDEGDVVQFTPVDLITVSNKEAWVSGLPSKVALITQGQGFVEAGQQVQPQSGGVN